jgi:Ricin-type beta-trefoil lectin domain.
MAKRTGPAGSTGSTGEAAIWEQPLPWLGETEAVPASSIGETGAASASPAGETGSAGVAVPPSRKASDGETSPEAEAGSKSEAGSEAAKPNAVPPSGDTSAYVAALTVSMAGTLVPAPVGSLTVPAAEAEPEPVAAVTADPAEEAEPRAVAPIRSGAHFSRPAASAPEGADGNGDAGERDGEGGRSTRFLRLLMAKAGTVMAARSGSPSQEAQSERNVRLVGVMTAVAVLAALGLGTVAFMAVPDGAADASQPRAAHVEDGVMPKVGPGGAVIPSASAFPSSPAGHGKDGSPKVSVHAGPDAGARPGGGPSSGADGARSTHGNSSSGSGGGGKAVDASDSHSAGTKDATKTQTKPTPAATHAAVADNMIMGYGSSRCIGVSAHKGSDGSPLTLQGCAEDAWQKWVFASDGTVRSEGMCLDIANASRDNGATIQLARCNGGWAQKFNLNSSHDLVNSQIGMCVDAKDMGTAVGTRLQLWECGGTSNQKWHLA